MEITFDISIVVKITLENLYIRRISTDMNRIFNKDMLSLSELLDNSVYLIYLVNRNIAILQE